MVEKKKLKKQKIPSDAGSPKYFAVDGYALRARFASRSNTRNQEGLESKRVCATEDIQS